MKTVFVTVIGDGPVYCFKNIREGVNPSDIDLHKFYWDLDEYLEDDVVELSVVLENIKVLYSEDDHVYDVDDEGAIDITKNKGKYILVNDFFSDSYDLKLPFYVRQIDYRTIYEEFWINLEDDEEFDPKKLQLIKSDYELEFLPYGIMPFYLVYDGKLVVSDSEYDVEDRGFHHAWIYENKMPYASGPKSVSMKTLN